MNHPSSTGRLMAESAAGGPQPGDLLGSGAGARWPNLRRPRVAAAGIGGIGVPCSHSVLAHTPSVAYVPKTRRDMLGGRPSPLTRGLDVRWLKESRNRRRNACDHSAPNQSCIAIASRRDGRVTAASRRIGPTVGIAPGPAPRAYVGRRSDTGNRESNPRVRTRLQPSRTRRPAKAAGFYGRALSPAV